MSDRITMIVADDHPLFREGVVKTLESDPGLEVLAEAGDANSAVRVAAEHLPDIALLDVSMPGGGLWAAQQIVTLCPVVKVVMLTVAEDGDTVHEALEVGARGYVLKGVSGAELVGIIRNIHAGDAYITPALAATLLQASKPPPEKPDRLAALTAREREILERLAEGASNKQIAARLCMAERTVQHHMTNILQKLHVRNRVEAALIAQKAVLAKNGEA